jgi:hypothetical protein
MSAYRGTSAVWLVFVARMIPPQESAALEVPGGDVGGRASVGDPGILS